MEKTSLTKNKLKLLRMQANYLNAQHGIEPLTQLEVANATGVHPSILCLAEGGKCKLSVYNWIALAKFYKVSLDYILGLEEEEVVLPHTQKQRG